MRDQLAEDDDEARTQLDDIFERFEREQPALATMVGDTLAEPLDDTAIALGYFLALTVWLAFEEAHRGAISQVAPAEVDATRQLLDLDEELRRGDADEALDSDDVIAMEQPALVEFIHDHLDGALETHADDVDVDDVHRVYRAVVIELLSLSYAVKQPQGFPLGKAELLA